MTDQSTSWPGPLRPGVRRGRRRPARGRRGHPWRTGWLALAAVAAVALTAAACGGSSPGSGGAAGMPAAAASSSASSGGALKTTTINGATVLANAKGFTLYSFAPDTATMSNCTASCAQFWPPIKGPVTAGSGVTGMLGTIARSDGSTQATYNGHPLYTYVGDTGPGQAKGNGLNLSGGIWHEVTASGAPAPASTPGGGGYGY
jgi:predicted lipoprotein with Yx(FWY)xxD motif